MAHVPRHRPSRGLVPPVTHERRQPSGRPGSLRWLKSLLGRPLKLVHRNGKLHLVLAERRRAREVIEAEAAAKIADELGVRLLALPNEDAALAMRQAARVHDLLLHEGWAAVQALPAAALGEAAVQMRLLLVEAPSRRLEWFIEHLRTARVAAEVREEKAEAQRAAAEQ